MPNALYIFYEEFVAMSLAEIVAVVFAVLYLLLAIRQNIWCWFCAGVSTAIYVWVFAGAKLYMESALNVFYFAMAVYGWFAWRPGEQTSHDLPVSVWPARVHVTALSVIVILVLAMGTFLARSTAAAYPTLYSATTFAPLWATFLVARKVLENSCYFFVIDVVSNFFYWSRGLDLTALLFFIYVIMMPIGLVPWTRSMRNGQRVVPA